jgi:hypothetical protein
LGCRRHGERERQSDADYPNPNHLGASSLSSRMVQGSREPTLVVAEDTAFVSINGVPKLGVLTLSASITDGIN